MGAPQLSKREIAIIKGLIQHKGLNDQQVLSIFSHLPRNFNHRVIGAVRTGANADYAATPAASSADVERLLHDYEKLVLAAERVGVCPTDGNATGIRKAIDIMKSAIMIYNNQIISTRSETFIVLAVIAWTYVIHGHLRNLGVDPVYVDANGQKVKLDGKDKLWDLSQSLKSGLSGVSKGCNNNLIYLLAIRHEIEHRSAENINDEVMAKLQACALNFLAFVKEKFGTKYDFSHELSFAIQLQALMLKDPNALKGPGKVANSVAVVNAALEECMSVVDYNDPDYAFRVYVVPKVSNNSKRADQAVTFSPIGSNIEVAIKQVERPKYRMKEAIAKLRSAGVKGVTSYTFQKAWKDNGLKAPGKGCAIELGNQWFWYEEGIEEIKRLLQVQG